MAFILYCVSIKNQETKKGLDKDYNVLQICGIEELNII